MNTCLGNGFHCTHYACIKKNPDSLKPQSTRVTCQSTHSDMGWAGVTWLWLTSAKIKQADIKSLCKEAHRQLSLGTQDHHPMMLRAVFYWLRQKVHVSFYGFQCLFQGKQNKKRIHVLSPLRGFLPLRSCLFRFGAFCQCDIFSCELSQSQFDTLEFFSPLKRRGNSNLLQSCFSSGGQKKGNQAQVTRSCNRTGH